MLSGKFSRQCRGPVVNNRERVFFWRWRLAFAVRTAGAERSDSPCALETPDFTRNAPNIFNDRQEQDLGDALAEYFEADMRVAPRRRR